MNKYFTHNVLHVLNLSLILLSIVRIIKDLNFKLIFSVDKYVMQNLVIRKNNEIGLVGDGLNKLLTSMRSALALRL